MRFLEERRIGFDVGVALVPIVPGAVLNDLGFTEGKARPDAAMGYAACDNASAHEKRQGNVGAGTGAAIGRLVGNIKGMMKGGLGTASVQVGSLVVGALVVVNCNGDVSDPATGVLLAGTLTADRSRIAGAISLLRSADGLYKEGFPTNTTIGVVATNALLTKATATRIAIMAQDGLARTINPVHTLGDGDVIFCMGAGQQQADPNRVGALAAEVTAQAVVNAVRSAEKLRGVPSFRDMSVK